MEERIQKLISASGLMSRRAAEEAMNAGRVLLNGHRAALGEKADPVRDELLIDGKPLPAPDRHIYLMLNKPAGYVTTLSDEKGRKTVAGLTAAVETRVYPVGRLDVNSEGLLIMTNDGELANALMHPSGGFRKTYRVKVQRDGDSGDKDLKAEALLPALADSIEIDGRMTAPAEIVLRKTDGRTAVVDVTISEGRNRQVRRLCEHAGLRVLQLTRIQEGPLSLGHLHSGAFRYLTAREVAALKQALKTNNCPEKQERRETWQQRQA